MDPTAKRLPTDSDWAELTDEKELAKRREAAEKEHGNLDSETIAHMRRRAKSDLFFLNHALLGRQLMSPHLHGNLCHWLNETSGEQYRLILLPRNLYKTTVDTVGDSVQKALPDVGGASVYPASLGPNIKVLLAHETRESASRFLFDVASAFMSKPLMLALFPECIPSKPAQRINKWELDLPRTEQWREPTFDTIGAGGAAQGRHYHHIKMDDLIGEDARDSETVMKRVLNWFDNINSLLTRPKIDGWDLIGTFWAYNDIYAHALESYGVNKSISVLRNFDEEQIEELRDGILAVYGRSIVEDDKLIFPEETSWEYIEILRRNPMVYAAQYANNPRQAGLTEFDPAWLQFYGLQGEDELIIGEDNERIRVWDLDKVALVDPSMAESRQADPTGIIVTGTDRKNRVFVLETIKKRLKPPDLIDELFHLNAKWQLRTVAIEEVAFSGIYRYWMEDTAKRLRTNINISPYKTGRKAKQVRIRGLSPLFSAAQIFVSKGMHELRSEYEKFPMDPGNIHLLDALAQGPDVWARGLNRRKLESYAEAEEEVLRQRSALTGY